MRILLSEASMQRVLKGEQTAFVRRTERGDIAEAISHGPGVKSYTMIRWPMDTGWGEIKKGETYPITTGPDQPTQGHIFIRGLDKDDWMRDVIIRRLGFVDEDKANRQAQFEAWWDSQYPDTPWKRVNYFWYVHFALKTDPEQEIATDSVTVQQVQIDPSNPEDLDKLLGLLGLKNQAASTDEDEARPDQE